MGRTFPYTILALLLLLACPAIGAEPTKVPPDKAYEIGAGDVLYISVWKDETLTRQAVVLPDGTISLPLVGRLKAAGKRLEEFQEEVIERIKRYLPNPVLDVSVVETNSMVVYIIGRVNGPGRYPVRAPINVLQALAMAGGLNKFADENDIKIFRQEAEQTRMIPFDYKQVVSGQHLEQNIELQRGDVVVVP